MKLTPKQRRFAELYVELGNASEAYRQAYDVGENTSIETIKSKASHLKAQDNISTTIKRLQNDLQLQSQIDRSFIVQKYLDVINTHLGYKEAIAKDGILSKKDKEKIYAMSNSGYIKGSDVNTALKEISRMMGLDKVEEKKQEAQTINNIQINIKRDNDNE